MLANRIKERKVWKAVEKFEVGDFLFVSYGLKHPKTVEEASTAIYGVRNLLNGENRVFKGERSLERAIEFLNKVKK
jgi:hypothetical protein